MNVEFSKAITITDDLVITQYRIPLIDPVDITNGKLDRTTIKHLPILKAADIGETQSATVKVNGEYYVRGARAGGLSYYIDGCRVMGSPDIPLCGLDTYRMYNGFIPPKYGDALGGVVVMETRNFFGEQ